MKLLSTTSVFVLCALLASLAGCSTSRTGPAPLPAVACVLSCSDANAALAFGSVLELRLVDFTRPDARPIVLAERIESNPGQPPLHFHLLYNAAAIDATHDYGVEARILYKGRPLWVQPEPVPVITKEHPVVVSIVLQPPS